MDCVPDTARSGWPVSWPGPVPTPWLQLSFNYPSNFNSHNGLQLALPSKPINGTSRALLVCRREVGMSVINGSENFEPRIGRSVSLDHAAELLGVSRRTIYNRIREGRLQTIRTLGGSQRVLIDSVQDSRGDAITAVRSENNDQVMSRRSA
jgi:excisionase family DNA binding protein